MVCEVCHEEFDVEAYESAMEQYEDQIYRPGEDISRLTNLTDEEKSERRKEIEEIFADPRAYIANGREVTDE